MDVSIIIVNFNTIDLVLNCIKSIISHTVHLNYELIIVDNASTDGSQELIIKSYPDVILIQLDVNLGFGKANNIAAKISKGKYLFFLNSDTILLNNSIYSLFLFNERNPTDKKIGISGGILYDRNLKETASFGPIPRKLTVILSISSLLPRFTRLTNSEAKYFKKNGFLEVGYIMGADMFVEKTTFEIIGGFDPAIFMYYEESDLQLRLKYNDYHNFLILGPQIIHLEGCSSNKIRVNNNKRLIITKSIFYYFRKHSRLIPFLVFKIIFLLLRIVTILYPSYSWKEKREYLKQIIIS